MAAPYTIRIFVADGDPDGVRIIDRFNWTGKGFCFPRSKWPDVRKRPELDYAGVYILVGEAPSENEKPIVYIGEGDGIAGRIDSHAKNKDFWSWGVAFVSANRGLNNALVQWLEFSLLQQAKVTGRCTLDNSNLPTVPELTESETADVQGFLQEILQILPLVRLRVFEAPAAVALPSTPPSAGAQPSALKPSAASDPSGPDTIVIPAQKDGFDEVFLGQHCWYAIRIAGGMLPKIKWIAAYQTSPVSSITHYAPVKSIEPYGRRQQVQADLQRAGHRSPDPGRLRRRRSGLNAGTTIHHAPTPSRRQEGDRSILNGHLSNRRMVERSAEYVLPPSNAIAPTCGACIRIRRV